MQPASKNRTRLVPSAIPFNEAEQVEWDALTDEERLAVFNEMFDSPDCDTYVDETLDEIRASARNRIASRQASGAAACSRGR